MKKKQYKPVALLRTFDKREKAMNKELLQQCLDALIESRGDVDLCYAGVKAARLSFRQERQLGFYEEQLIKHDAAIEALKQALAQQEPPGPATPEDMKIYKGIADGYRRDAAQQEPNPWKTAVIDQLVIHHVYQAAHDTDPRKAVHDLLCISNDIALDPQVSSDAQALIDRGGREARQEQPASVDAYVGAREDVAIWKKRALEAEGLNRKFIADVNGPTYFGEPVKQEQPEQEPVAWLHGTTFQVVVSKNRPNSLAAWLPLFAHPAPTQPALSELFAAMDEAQQADAEVWKDLCTRAVEQGLREIPISAKNAESINKAKRVRDLFTAYKEAHCRGGAK